MPAPRAIAAKSGLTSSTAVPRKPLAIISISTKPSVPLFSTMIFTGSFSCTSVSMSPISMVNPPSPENEMTWRCGYAAWAPIACGRAFAIEPWLSELTSRRLPFMRM